ncbi:hypothetical protein AB0G02_01265 [Actinosynnema sp. NPDC023658]|uniref:hypothetical protein n=1 Tax=Actinosynnema sp. NPDC023658 TaxID=3155465 RepID=UPI0033DE210C
MTVTEQTCWCGGSGLVEWRGRCGVCRGRGVIGVLDESGTAEVERAESLAWSARHGRVSGVAA